MKLESKMTMQRELRNSRGRALLGWMIIDVFCNSVLSKSALNHASSLPTPKRFIAVGLSKHLITPIAEGHPALVSQPVDHNLRNATVCLFLDQDEESIPDRVHVFSHQTS
jgi:hypothetical protein